MHFHTVGSVVDASTGDPLGRKNGDSSTFSKNSRSSVYRIASGSALSSSSSSVSSFNVAFVMLLLLLLLLLDDDDDDVKRKKRSCWCSLRLVLKGAVVVVIVVVVMSSFKGFFVVLVKVEQLYESSKSSRKSKVDRRLCGYIYILRMHKVLSFCCLKGV